MRSDPTRLFSTGLLEGYTLVQQNQNRTPADVQLLKWCRIYAKVFSFYTKGSRAILLKSNFELIDATYASGSALDPLFENLQWPVST